MLNPLALLTQLAALAGKRQTPATLRRRARLWDLLADWADWRRWRPNPKRAKARRARAAQLREDANIMAEEQVHVAMLDNMTCVIDEINAALGDQEVRLSALERKLNQ